MLFFCQRCARAAAILCGYATLALAFLVAFEVVARKLFNFSFQGVDEIGGYVVATVAALGFSRALVMRSHTRVDILLARLPAGVQAVLNLLAQLSIAAFALFMVERAVTTFADSLAYQSVASTPLQTPLWIPQAVWVVGLALFGFVALIYAIHAVRLFRRDRVELNRTFAPQSMREEVEQVKGEQALTTKAAR